MAPNLYLVVDREGADRMATDPARDQPAASPATGRGRGRRFARTLAFQTLYEMDVSRHRPGEVLQRLIVDERAQPEVGEFARDLVTGVLRHRAEIDDLLQKSAPAFPLAQMSPVDRNI